MARRRSASRIKIVPQQLAVRYRKGHERAVSELLSQFGEIEEQPATRVYILHKANGVSPRTIEAALKTLKEGKHIEFATPVVRDAESGRRQVLTDEIVVRLKPDAPQQRTLATLKAEHGVQVGKRNEFEPTQYIVKVPHAAGTQTIDIAEVLDGRADVEFASPNYLVDIKR